MIDREPVAVDGVEEVLHERPDEIRALAEHVLGEAAEEGVLRIPQAPIQLAVREVARRVAVDRIEDHGDAAPVRSLDQPLQVGTIAEALVDTEVADGQEAPVHGHRHVGHRHDLEAVDAEIREVVSRAIVPSMPSANSSSMSS